MECRLVIPGTLPNYNDSIAKYCLSKFRGSEHKRETEKRISKYIKKQLKGVKLKEPVTFRYTFYEPNRKRDPSNIMLFGVKTIEDALVKCGVIDNDGWRNVSGLSIEFYIDEANPRIEVTMREAWF